jgi:starvation-inducible outer membrane lipoprotein
MIKNKFKLIGIFGLLLFLSGCETGPQQPQRQLTPLEACLENAKSENRSCVMSTLCWGNHCNQAVIQDRQQKCTDRLHMQEDRCYARFK